MVVSSACRGALRHSHQADPSRPVVPRKVLRPRRSGTVLRPRRMRRRCPCSSSPGRLVVTDQCLGPIVECGDKLEYRSASSAVPPTALAESGLMYPSRPVVRPDSSSTLFAQYPAKQLTRVAGSTCASATAAAEPVTAALCRIRSRQGGPDRSYG